MKREYYSSSIRDFRLLTEDAILGKLASRNEFALEQTQRDTWLYQVRHLKGVLQDYEGAIFFEYAIPRMGARIDVLLVIRNAIFVIEYKVGGQEFLSSAIEQVWDYALDLKNFHETSHAHLIAPILVATEARDVLSTISTTSHNDNVLLPIKTNAAGMAVVINSVLQFADGDEINSERWALGRYSPTPTIIEAAKALYSGHGVEDISRSDASAINLRETSSAISEIIEHAKANRKKAICFVTGVPGAGKTLVGLKVATNHMDKDAGITSIFLSGNGPLVEILREALARDKIKTELAQGRKIKKGAARSQVKVFIQNVHHFRDECLIDEQSPPFDHVAIFDEAQRAWNHEQTAKFMKNKKGRPNFSYSEPEFLVSCLDRHQDWAVIVCLVGGGQEINTGEGGIAEWVNSITRSFPEWQVHVSDKLTDSEFSANEALEKLKDHKDVFLNAHLHLSVSMRSYRAESVSQLVKDILDCELDKAKETYNRVKERYPIVLTRDLNKAKQWLKSRARGSERYGLIVSSQAQRLKPHAIDVKSPMDPVNWFLEDKDDVRSSYYLEDVATEFAVQGLELDWTCVTWDGDFRYNENGWQCFSFVGNKWQNIIKAERQLYLKNAYRVLLTRARQGMIIVVPEGSNEDPTRSPEFYDSTYKYLKEIGFLEI